jgi:putative acetyltransferase
MNPPLPPCDAVDIRIENVQSVEDCTAIRAVITAAFQRVDEADLVDQLRADNHALLSLVAEREGSIVGHVLFSRMWIDTARGRVSAVALAPVAVLPDHQRKGIAARLITRGIELLRQRNEVIVIVLGNPDYYLRFGFSAEKSRSLKSPFPPEAFMAMELTDGALDGIEGSVVYPSAFGI